MIACTVCASRGRLVRIVPLGPRVDVLAHASPVEGFAELLVLDLLFDHAPAPYAIATPGSPDVPAIVRMPPLVLVIVRGLAEASRSLMGRGNH